MTPLTWQQELLVAVVKIAILFGITQGLFTVMTWAERRLLAFMQFRLGPNRTGPFGILQPLADGVKLFFKEELMPAGAERWAFVLAPCLSVVAAFMAIAVIPYGPKFTLWGRTFQMQIADLDVGLLYIFAITALGVYGVVMAGWASNSKFALLGGLRSSAQMFSYELALGLSWVSIIMLAGSFKIADIVDYQSGPIWRWFVFTPPFLAFFVYFIAACAEVSRTPFDLPEGETELVAGFHTEYSSMKFALLQMAEYVNMITVAVLATNLFLGGWHSGIPALDPLPGLGFVVFVTKVLFILFVFIWLRGTVPRFRYDQLMHFGWKVLVPVAMLNIVVTAAYVAFLS